MLVQEEPCSEDNKHYAKLVDGSYARCGTQLQRPEVAEP